MATDFDEKAHTWDDDPTRVERARAAADAVRGAVVLQPSSRLLEYGAGTGLVAQFLAGEVGAITLADPSAGMRDVMAQKVQAGVLPTGTRIWDLDLATAPAPDERFDLIVTVMTLHHIHDVESVLRGFAALLSDGGDLCVVDLDEEDGSFHDDPSFDGHHGMSRATLTAQLQRAGFRAIRFAQCYEVEREGRSYPLFLAWGRIPFS